MNLKIKNHIINLSTFSNIKEIEKAIEGVYCDSPLNRKLGRVGMSYSSYNDYIQRKNDGEDVDIENYKKDDTLKTNEAFLKYKLKNIEDFHSTNISLTNGDKISIEYSKLKGYKSTILNKNYDIVDELSSTKKDNFINNLNIYLYENDYKIKNEEIKSNNNNDNKDNKDKALTKLKDLPEEFSPNKIFKNSVKFETKRDITKFFIKRFEVKEAYQVPLDKRSKLWDDAREENISINNIVPSQDYLNKEVIEQKINNSKNEIPLGISLKFSDGISDKIILFDGHHRVAADILEGKENIPIKIIGTYELFKHYKNK